LNDDDDDYVGNCLKVLSVCDKTVEIKSIHWLNILIRDHCNVWCVLCVFYVCVWGASCVCVCVFAYMYMVRVCRDLVTIIDDVSYTMYKPSSWYSHPSNNNNERFSDKMKELLIQSYTQRTLCIVSLLINKAMNFVSWLFRKLIVKWGQPSSGFLRSWKSPWNQTLLEKSWKFDPSGKIPGNLILLENSWKFDPPG